MKKTKSISNPPATTANPFTEKKRHITFDGKTASEVNIEFEHKETYVYEEKDEIDGGFIPIRTATMKIDIRGTEPIIEEYLLEVDGERLRITPEMLRFFGRATEAVNDHLRDYIPGYYTGGV